MPAPTESTTESFQRHTDAAHDLVVCDPEIMGGIPTIRGTRIHVYDIAAWVAAGETMDDILDSYPSLSPEQVRLAALYAETNPYHGRPPQPMSIPEGATILVWDTIPMPKRS